MDELEIDGKKYISSRRAAKEHKYHIDYIGQLIRAGKVHGKKVGRSWYVEEASLKAYLLAEAAPSSAPAPAFVPEPAAPAPVIEVVEAMPEPTPQVMAEKIEEEISMPVTQVQHTVAERMPTPEIKNEDERVVHINAQRPIEKKPSTLIYVGDDEPMLPVLNGRVRQNADFVVPMRKLAEEPPVAEDNGERDRMEETVATIVRTGSLPKARKQFALPRLQTLAIVGMVMLVIAATVSTMLSTSIKVNDDNTASVGLTIK